MNVRLTAVLLLIVSVLIGWHWSQQAAEQTDLSQLVKKEGEPQYQGQKTSTSVYDLQGKPQYFAEADAILRFEETERTEFTKPLVNLFDQVTALKQWKVSADKAEITKDKMLHLIGNVKIEALEATSKLQKIETEQLSVNLDTQDIFTDRAVKSVGQGFTTQGVGLKGNLKQQTATLLKDVKTYIEPTVIKSQSDSEKDKE